MKRVLWMLSLICTSVSLIGDDITSWTNYASVPAEDGTLRLRAYWKRTSPAYDILTEGHAFRLSQVEGATYEFCVLIQNIGKTEIEVPSSPKGGMALRSMPVGKDVVVPCIIKFEDDFEPLRYIDAPAKFSPVKLKPGEATRLPIYYRICVRVRMPCSMHTR